MTTAVKWSNGNITMYIVSNFSPCRDEATAFRVLNKYIAVAMGFEFKNPVKKYVFKTNTGKHGGV